MGLNVGGNQPNVPGMPTGPTSEPKHAADVDPNKLLLMVPDLDKRARELNKLSKSVDQSQDKTMNDLQDKALVDFAKSLISEPDLPEGSKAALEKWISDILSDDTATTTTTTTQGDTPDAAPQMATRSAVMGQPQQPGSAVPGQPQQSGQTTTTTTTTTQTPIPLGGDPAELLTDDPSVSSAPVKSLGHLASTIAAAQKGTLTPEQVTMLTQEANNLMGAVPSNLTDADTAMLQSFIGQLAEFPTNDPKSPTKSSSTSQNAQTRSAKAPDTAPLEMSELGLSDVVQELGQKAMSFIQGNNGKVSEREAKQLEEAAEALIAGGADGDDLKALQNFIKALANFPRTATPGGPTAGATPDDSPLLMAQPNINPRMANLGQMASSMLKAQGNTLTPDEVGTLASMAESLLADATPEEAAILQKWLGTLGGVKTQAPPQMHVFTQSMLFGTTPARNPYMSPGIMTMLAPILAEILQVNNDIIKQSSKLKQSMMKMLVAMAEEAFKFAMTAGAAKAAQMEKEAAMHMALGISQCVQAGMAVGVFAVQSKQQSKFANESKSAQQEKKISSWLKGEDLGPKPDPKVLADRNKAYGKAMDMGATTPEQLQSALRSSPQGKGFPELSKQTMAEKVEMHSQASQRMNISGAMLVKEMVQHLGQATDSFISGIFKASQVQDILREASANAYKDMISQLMQLITGTIQSATEEMQAAQRNFESFSQLYRDFANTITQGIYRSG